MPHGNRGNFHGPRPAASYRSGSPSAPNTMHFTSSGGAPQRLHNAVGHFRRQ